MPYFSKEGIELEVFVCVRVCVCACVVVCVCRGVFHDYIKAWVIWVNLNMLFFLLLCDCISIPGKQGRP